MREGMVDPTGLSFAQPKGGLKRGETLADELNTKRPKAKEPIAKEPKDRASQASARDDGEARSKRRRTTSAPPSPRDLDWNAADERRLVSAVETAGTTRSWCGPTVCRW